MNPILKKISVLSQLVTVTGYEKESELARWIEAFPCLNGAKMDALGNIIVTKEAKAIGAKRLLIEAHRDVIGFCVSELLDGGFFRASACGGISPAILPGTELLVHGKQVIRAIATSIPPHLKKENSSGDEKKVSEIYFDTGITSKKRLEGMIHIGDPVVFASKPLPMQNNVITAPGLDNLAGVLAMIECLETLHDPKNHVDFLISAGEETLSSGVRFAVKNQSYDCAIITDAGFAKGPGLDSTKCIEMGKGPSVSFTDTLCVTMSKSICSIACQHSLPLQCVAEPGGTGTSATALQISNGGIPCAVLSIPVSNMHTPAETVNTNDIRQTAFLLNAICNADWDAHGEVIL